MPFVRTQLPSNRTGASVGNRGPGGWSRAGVGGPKGDMPEGPARRVPVLIGQPYRGEAGGKGPPRFVSQMVQITGAFRLTGTTRDSTGTQLGNCTVHLFNSADQEIAETISDGSGAFTFTADANSGTYYLVAYLAGSPDVAGTSLKTLTLDYTVA